MSEKQINHSQRFGIILVLSCGIMWGISGVLGQYVFQSSDVNATQLSIIRQFISGVVLLVIAAVKGDKRALTIWSKPKSVISMLFFALSGVMGVQFTYFASIEHSNAATGTVIQFTYIIMLCICRYLSDRHTRQPEFPCHIQAGAHMGTHLSGMFHYILPLSSEALQ